MPVIDHKAVPNVPDLWISNCVVCGEETKKILEMDGTKVWVHVKLMPRDWQTEPVDRDLTDDLAYVLMSMVVGWEERLGVDLAQHPEVQRVMARYREERA